jgi:hypothetical protein
MAYLNTAKYTEAIEYLKVQIGRCCLGALAKEQSEMLHKITRRGFR